MRLQDVSGRIPGSPAITHRDNKLLWIWGAPLTGFFKEVYEIVAEIPPGKVASYGQIAAMLGNPRAARTVGWAMAGGPRHLQLPCHRVVNKAGRLSPDPVFGGYEVQRAELEAEGVIFKRDGRIDMKKCMWRPDKERQ